MLQSAPNSTSLNAIARLIEKEVTDAANILDAIHEMLNEIRKEHYEEYYFAYAGNYYSHAAAYVGYWILRQLSQKPVYIDEVESLIYHVLAYRHERKVIALFAEPGAENMIGRLSDTAMYTNSRLLILAPPLPPLLKSRVLDNTKLIEVAMENTIIPYILSSALIAVELLETLSENIKLRWERVKNELSNLKPIIPELLEKYKEQVNGLSSIIRSGAKEEQAILAYTPTMKPPALLFAAILERSGAKALVKSVSSMLTQLASLETRGISSEKLVIFTTDAEQDSLRELSFKLSMSVQTVKVIEVRLRTDPLTAPIYASLLIEAARLLAARRE